MSVLLGFTFANIHSSTVGLYLDTPKRIIKPGLRTNEYIVPGKSGSIDYGGDTYDPIEITCKLAYKADNLSDMRLQQRKVAEFLAGSGQLIFDDEPDKAYSGKVIQSVSLIEAVRTGTMDVVFNCQPFAESINYRQLQQQGNLPISFMPDVNGTQETPCIIRIQCSSSITGLTITRTRLN